MTAADHTTTTGPDRQGSPSLDEALAQAARCLGKAEEALPEKAATLNQTAHHWLDMANILLARSMPIR
jgi:2-methylcitrate dehydratase PrpD